MEKQIVMFDGIEITMRRRKRRPGIDPAKPLAYDLLMDRIMDHPNLIPDPAVRNHVIKLLRVYDMMGYGKSRARLQPGIEPDTLKVAARMLGECLGLLECERYENPADFGLRSTLRAVQNGVLDNLAQLCDTILEREDKPHGPREPAAAGTQTAKPQRQRHKGK
jgi:hypothetical protein